jgi:hypothetical protein
MSQHDVILDRTDPHITGEIKRLDDNEIALRIDEMSNKELMEIISQDDEAFIALAGIAKLISTYESYAFIRHTIRDQIIRQSEIVGNKLFNAVKTSLNEN